MNIALFRALSPPNVQSRRKFVLLEQFSMSMGWKIAQCPLSNNDWILGGKYFYAVIAKKQLWSDGAFNLTGDALWNIEQHDNARRVILLTSQKITPVPRT